MESIPGMGRITSLQVDGGASRNNLLMQFQSDISGLPVTRPATAEATALGAAFLAGLGVGFFESREALIRLLASGGETFTPRMQQTDRARLLEGWTRAVNACRTF